MSGGHDRGSFHNVQIEVCARGFLLTVNNGPGMMGIPYAFDKIEDAADWLTDQWRDIHNRDQDEKQSPDEAAQ